MKFTTILYPLIFLFAPFICLGQITINEVVPTKLIDRMEASPNPVKSVTCLKIPPELQSNYSIKIINLLGKAEMVDVQSSNLQEICLNLEALANGTYLIAIYNKQHKQTIKIIKQ